MNRPPDSPPFTLRWPVMRQQWQDLAYLHWEVDPDEVVSRLPDGLEPDLFEGSAWVGLVPFQIRDIGLPFGPGVPYFGTFPETNVRTYVTGSAGPGVWFDSLDATRLVPVGAARGAFGLPYMWSSMSIDQDGDTVRYRTRRRWGGPKATSDVSVRIGRPVLATDLDLFLTARWRLYSVWFGRVMHAPVEHPPWVLREATANYHDGLVGAAGYTVSGEPLVRYSHGVPVRVGRPRFLR